MGNAYLYVKVVHVIAVIVWLGGMVMMATMIAMFVNDTSVMRVLGASSIRTAHKLFMPAAIITLLSGIALMIMVGGRPPVWMIWGLIAGPVSSVIGSVITRKTGMAMGQLMAKPGVTDAELDPLRTKLKNSIFLNVLLAMSVVVVMVLKPF